jgi:hypothetical protein
MNSDALQNRFANARNAELIELLFVHGIARACG